MSKDLTIKPSAKLENLLMRGDLKDLTQDERLQHINNICKLIGISPLLRPFDYLTLQNKTTLYVTAGGAAQLRAKHRISIDIVSAERVDGLYVVRVKAETGSGIRDGATGAINIKGLGGAELANAMMKAETKAKRRVTLSITGLGMLDEIEAHEIAEREVKTAAAEKVEQVEAKIVSEKPDGVTSPIAQEILDQRGYVMKSGRNKGKELSKMTEKALIQWLKFYDDRKATKIEMHPEVDEDAFFVRAHLDGLKLEKAEAPSMEQQP